MKTIKVKIDNKKTYTFTEDMFPDDFFDNDDEEDKHNASTDDEYDEGSFWDDT